MNAVILGRCHSVDACSPHRRPKRRQRRLTFPVTKFDIAGQVRRFSCSHMQHASVPSCCPLVRKPIIRRRKPVNERPFQKRNSAPILDLHDRSSPESVTTLAEDCQTPTALHSLRDNTLISESPLSATDDHERTLEEYPTIHTPTDGDESSSTAMRGSIRRRPAFRCLSRERSQSQTQVDKSVVLVRHKPVVGAVVTTNNHVGRIQSPPVVVPRHRKSHTSTEIYLSKSATKASDGSHARSPPSPFSSNNKSRTSSEIHFSKSAASVSDDSHSRSPPSPFARNKNSRASTDIHLSKSASAGWNSLDNLRQPVAEVPKVKVNKATSPRWACFEDSDGSRSKSSRFTLPSRSPQYEKRSGSDGKFGKQGKGLYAPDEDFSREPLLSNSSGEEDDDDDYEEDEVYFGTNSGCEQDGGSVGTERHCYAINFLAYHSIRLFVQGLGVRLSETCPDLQWSWSSESMQSLSSGEWLFQAGQGSSGDQASRSGSFPSAPGSGNDSIPKRNSWMDVCAVNSPLSSQELSSCSESPSISSVSGSRSPEHQPNQSNAINGPGGGDSTPGESHRDKKRRHLMNVLARRLRANSISVTEMILASREGTSSRNGSACVTPVAARNNLGPYQGSMDNSNLVASAKAILGKTDSGTSSQADIERIMSRLSARARRPNKVSPFIGLMVHLFLTLFE